MGWEGVIGIIVTLVGLFFTIGKPIIELNKNITTLNVSVENNNQRLDKQEKDAHESHTKLWAHNDNQDEKLADHETRISILETK